MGALYQISFPTGRRYIGMTVGDPERRFLDHRYHAKIGRPYPLHRAIRKYGVENAKFEVLVIADGREYLEMLERNAIRVFGTRAPNGYNATDGGDGAPLGNQYQLGLKRSAESRAKMSASGIGRRHTVQTKAKIGAASKGNKHSLGRVQNEAERILRSISQIGKRKGGASGHVGVSFNKNSDKWIAHITIRHKMISLGYFDRLEDAIAARKVGEKMHLSRMKSHER